MKNANLLKWAQNKNKLSNGSGGKDGSNSNGSSSNGKSKDEKKWIHSSDTLAQGHVVYLVKFLGSTEVDKPKGIDVVKQGIQKLKFSQQLKKSEGSSGGSNKTPKVELTISVQGVRVQEPKTKKLLHEYPLYKISYCADDKAEKRFFSFIAKEEDSGQHTCFVFVSDKLAEEITLTIGQAFELAYKKYLDTNGKEMETKKQLMVLQKRVVLLENENAELKKRLKDVANIKGQQDVMSYLQANKIADLCEVRAQTSSPSPAAAAAAAPAAPAANASSSPAPAGNGAKNHTNSPAADEKTNMDELICLDSVATKLDGFTLDDLDDDDFNPRASGNASGSGSGSEEDFDPRGMPPLTMVAPVQSPALAPAVVLAPPPTLPPRDSSKMNNTSMNNQSHLAAFPSATSSPAQPTFPNNDIFSSGGNPFDVSGGSGGAADPFGMSVFDSAVGKNRPNNTNDAFQTGIAAANFSLDELDPLKK